MGLDERISRVPRPAGRRRRAGMRPGDPLELTERELRSLSRLEGRPLPRSDALAEILGVSRVSAWRFIRRLRRERLLVFGTGLRSRPDICECVSYVNVDWSSVGDAEIMDDLFRRDPAIVRADRIAGKSDYRLVSHHADYRAANSWSRELMARPGVGRVTTKICKTIIDRLSYAEARLAADDAAGAAVRRCGSSAKSAKVRPVLPQPIAPRSARHSDVEDSTEAST